MNRNYVPGGASPREFGLPDAMLSRRRAGRMPQCDISCGATSRTGERSNTKLSAFVVHVIERWSLVPQSHTVSAMNTARLGRKQWCDGDWFVAKRQANKFQDSNLVTEERRKFGAKICARRARVERLEHDEVLRGISFLCASTPIVRG